jgi:hypothetical protein
MGRVYADQIKSDKRELSGGSPWDATPRNLRSGLDNFEQKQDQHDGEDKAETTTAVIAETGTHAIAAKTEDKYQDDEEDEHFCSVSLLQIYSGGFIHT